MKRSTAVAMIVEAHRQGQSAAQHLYDIATKQMLDAFPTQMVEVLRAENDRLQAEVARLTALLGNVSNLEKAFEIRGVHICDLSDKIEQLTVETEADKELASLVRAMPPGWSLLNCTTYWSAHSDVCHGANGNTPAEALRAAGVGEEEEPCQSI